MITIEDVKEALGKALFVGREYDPTDEDTVQWYNEILEELHLINLRKGMTE